MKKISFVSKSLVLLSLISGITAQSVFADNITQLVIEKMVNADKKTGFILTSDIEPLRNSKMKQGTFFNSKTIIIKEDLLKQGYKTFSLDNDINGYGDIVNVKDAQENEIKRISVGRQAFKMIKSNRDNHIFVLCKGYFGSVWEIDPNINQVVKKYSTSWNPSDLALSTDGKFLYVASGKIQKFSTDSDIVLEPIIPTSIRYFNSVNPVSDTTMIFGGINREGTQVNYSMNISSTNMTESYSTAIFVPDDKQTINVEVKAISKPTEMTLLYSKNNDFLHLFSTKTGTVEAIIPLDSKIDEVIMLTHLNKALVLHRLIGQISIIDLTPNSNTQYSVFARIIDERLKDPTNTFVYDANKVYIKSDNSQEGFIDTDNLLRYTYPIVEIPNNRIKEYFKIAKLADKRYTLKNNKLYYEDIKDEANLPSRKIRLNNFGNTVGGIEISQDSKILYYSDYSKNMIYAIDTFNNKILAQFDTGSEPSEIILSTNNLYVLNKGDQTISVIDVKSGQTSKISRLKIDNNNLNVIKLYDKEFDQILKITLAPDVDNKDFIMVKAEN